jgi:hypothetical protein
MIRARQRHQCSIEALDAGRAEHTPDHDFGEDGEPPPAHGQRACGLRREYDRYEEQEEL